MADQAARRRKRVLANAEARLQKLRGTQTDQNDEGTIVGWPEPAAVAVLDSDATSTLPSLEVTGGTEEAYHLPARAVPPQPLKVRGASDDPITERPSEDATTSSSASADTEHAEEVAAVSSSSPTTETASGDKHSTVAEQHAEKLEQMHQKKKQLPGKTTRGNRLWQLVGVVLAAILVLLHVNGVVSASSACISLVVMATTQTASQKPKSALQFVVSLLSQVLTSISLFMFILVVYHMIQTMTVSH